MRPLKSAPVSPGMICVTAAPPPGPVTARRSIECALWLEGRLMSRISTVSPARTRKNGPGRVPPNIQNVYSTPFASVPFSSVVKSSTTTRAGRARSSAGGTAGGAVSTALISPSGLLPSSPRCQPPLICAATVPATSADPPVSHHRRRRDGAL